MWTSLWELLILSHHLNCCPLNSKYLSLGKFPNIYITTRPVFSISNLTIILCLKAFSGFPFPYRIKWKLIFLAYHWSWFNYKWNSSTSLLPLYGKLHSTHSTLMLNLPYCHTSLLFFTCILFQYASHSSFAYLANTYQSRLKVRVNALSHQEGWPLFPVYS